MQIEIEQGPGNAAAHVRMTAGEHLTAEAGSMIAMSGGMSLSTTTHKRGSGSAFKALKRMLAGESFFLNHYQCAGNSGELWLATTLPGDMHVEELNGKSLIVQGGSFVASEEGVDMDLNWQGLKTVFSGESLFWIKVSGRGKVVFNSFGAIYPLDVTNDVIVDTGHIVAFEDTLKFEISKAGKSWLHSILGGEGLVCRFSGQGRVWCQSHNPGSFGSMLGNLLKPRSA